MFESLLIYPLKMAFAGVWAFIFSWGLSVGLIICLLLCAYFTTAVPFIGPYLTDMRKHLVMAAAAVAIFLGGQVVGQRNASQRHEKQQEIVEDAVDKAVKKAQTPASRAKKDKWDRPEYIRGPQ